MIRSNKEDCSEGSRCVEAVEAAGRKKVLSNLVSGQKLLAEEVERQQKTLMTHIE